MDKLVTGPDSWPTRAATGVVVAAAFAVGAIALPIGEEIALVVSAIAVFSLVAIIGPSLRRPKVRHSTGSDARALTEISTSDVSDYAAILAHELGGPVIGISASAQMLAKELQGSASGTKARAIATEARQIYSLLETLTDLSAAESGRLRLSLRPVAIGGLVHETIDAMHLPDHRVVLDGVDSSLAIVGDAPRLRQVVRNLVANAAKYSPVGTSIEVTVGMTSDHRSGIVDVRDHGPGVPLSERSRLFSKFARLSTASGTRGSGLGLYICRAIIADHGGELWAEWPPSGGSRFAFTVPLAKSEAIGPSSSPVRITSGDHARAA